MFNLADLFVLLFLLFHAYNGWRKGLFKSLLGPISFVICCLFAWLYFKRTHNVLISLTISLLGPIVIKIFVPWIVQLASEGTLQPSTSSIGLINRWLGSAVGLVWGMIMASLLLLFVVINPAASGPVASARLAVSNSLVFSGGSSYWTGFSSIVLAANSRNESTAEMDSPKANQMQSPDAQALAQSEEYQNLYNDERVKELLSDPEVKQLIEEKQYMKLLQNPRFAKILDDPSLIARMVQLQSKINKQQ